MKHHICDLLALVFSYVCDRGGVWCLWMLVNKLFLSHFLLCQISCDW